MYDVCIQNSKVFYDQDLDMDFDKEEMKYLSKKYNDVITYGVNTRPITDGINVEKLDSLNQLSIMENINAMTVLASEFAKKVINKLKRLTKNA